MKNILDKKLWTIIIISSIVLAVVISLNGDNKSSRKTANASHVAEKKKKAVSIKPNPITHKSKKYQIIHELKNTRYDGGKSYYVLVKEINLGVSDFKDDIKRIINAIAKRKGEKISISFLNDRKTLDLMYKSHYGNNTLGRILTKSEQDRIAKSLIAEFDGQLKTNLYLNTLSFFPAASVNNLKIGTYIETTEYNLGK